jgi:hypothetical protein
VGTLAERIRHVRDACAQALDGPDLVAAARFLDARSVDVERGAHLLRATAAAERPTPELLAARAAARVAPSVARAPAAIERLLLVRAALATAGRIADLAVGDSVKHLLCAEFLAYAAPPRGSLDRFAMDTSSFIIMSRIVTGFRVPAGLFDWEVSGFPRRWLLKVPPRLLPGTLKFVAVDARGLGPFLVWHMAGSVWRARFILESEVLKSFYRTATAVERQPEVKAIMAASWLVSRETHRVSPHLQCLVRPFLAAGGVYTEAGPASAVNGFLLGDAKRRALYEAGAFRPTTGIVMCSRLQAMAWKACHPELAPVDASDRPASAAADEKQ